MKFLLVTICVLGLAATLARGDPCPCQTTTTPAPDCGCDCGGDGGDGQDATWNEGLTHYWPFDHEMEDHVGADHIQKCVGDWLWDTDHLGNENGSITFTDAFCTLPGSIYFSGPFTIALWTMIPADSNSTVQILLFSHMVFSDALTLSINWDSEDPETTGPPRASFVMQSATNVIVDVIGQTVVPISDWFHIALTFDGLTCKLYINGDFDSQDNASDVFYAAYRNANAFGGANIQGYGARVAASYDDVRIYGRDLSADEVSGLFNSPNTAPSYEEDQDVMHCNDEPYGACLKNCNETLSFPLHYPKEPCGNDLVCCVERPQEDNACVDSGAFCVQRDACRVGDLKYVSGCDEGSVAPICCLVEGFYNTAELDPFGINNHSQECQGVAMLCAQASDCCSYSCGAAGCTS